MPIKVTRALVTGALDCSLKSVSFRTDPYFGFSVPTSVPGIESHILYPMKTRKERSTRLRASSCACSRRISSKFEQHVDVRSAAPEVRTAAK